jgi:hypothetical protein
MKSNSKQDERIATMTFSSVYPHYVSKVVKKGRTIEELIRVITWLTALEFVEIEKDNYRQPKNRAL